MSFSSYFNLSKTYSVKSCIYWHTLSSSFFSHEKIAMGYLLSDLFPELEIWIIADWIKPKFGSISKFLNQLKIQIRDLFVSQHNKRRVIQTWSNFEKINFERLGHLGSHANSRIIFLSVKINKIHFINKLW